MDPNLKIAGLGKKGSSGNRKSFLLLVVTFILSFILSSNALGKIGYPAVSISASSLVFGSSTVGTVNGPKSVTITNTGTGVLTLISITLKGGNSGDFSATNNCGRSLAAKASCAVQVTFKPSTAGTRATTLYITDYASGSPQKVAVSGTAVAAKPVVTLSSSSLSFGSFAIGTSAGPASLSVTNSGNATLNITSIGLSGGNASDFSQTNSCSSSLVAGAACQVQVMFNPSTAGVRTTTLSIADNASGSPQIVTISGTGTGSPIASLSGTSLVFPNQVVGTMSAALVATLTNTGNAALSVTGIAVSGANAGDFSQANSCGASLAASASCAISVTFRPAAAGIRSAILSISDSATGSPQAISLSGTGTSPVAAVSPASVIFGNQPLSIVSAAQSVVLTNTGNASLTVSGIALSGTNAGDFVQTNNCGSSVAAGAFCTISVTFTPAASGNRSASLTIADNAAGSPQAVSLSGTGTAPVAAVSPTSVTFGNQPLSIASAAQSAVLTNTGNAPLTLTGIAVSGANAGDFVQTNNCGSTVAAGASCTISVTFTPSATGSRSASVSVANNAAGSPQAVSLSGTGAAPAASVSSSSLAFGNQSLNTTSAAQTVVLGNTGNSSLTVTGIAVSGANAGDFIQTNNCGSTVAAGASCTISITFTPSAAGSRSASVSVADDATGSPQAVALSGTGAAAAASVSTSSLAFGNQSLNTTSAAQTVVLSNTGNGALTVSGIAVSGANAGDFVQTNNCGSSVAAGASCTISVTFRPSATGSRAASLCISDNAAGSPQAVTLSGTGTAAAAGVSPSNLAFGNQPLSTTSAAQSVVLTNTGNAALSVTGIALSGVNAGDFVQTNNCGSSVAAGASCTISVTFTPAASGNRSASLTIADNAAGSPQAVTLSGTGTAAGASVSPSTRAFGNQPLTTTSAAQSVVLTNTGNAALTVTGIAISGANAGDFVQTNNCGSSVAAGASCTISVTFTPAASGNRSASLSIADSATGSPQAVSLSGTGTAAVASISTSSLAFGNQPLSTPSAAQSVVLTNTGNAVLNIAGITVAGSNAGDFQLTNSCGSSVAAGGSCTLSVIFNPSAAGARSAAINIVDSAVTSPQCVSLSGTGTNATASASLSPASLSFSSEPVMMTSSALTITLANTGSIALAVSSITVTGANASEFVQNNNCAASLAPGANCTVVILFTPSATGARSAAVTIADNAGSGPQTANLTGTGSHDVILSWTASTTPGIVGYNIYRGTTSGGESSTPLNSTPICGITYSDTNVTGGAHYYYQITAVASDNVTQSSGSQESTATVPTT